MDKIAVYIHGKDGNVNEAEHYKPLFPQYDVKGFDYKAQTPWEAKKEFSSAIRSLCKEYESVTLIANSIGAYFALHSLAGQRIEKAFLISPIVDMEELIIQMMAQAGITEGELEKRKEKRDLYILWEKIIVGVPVLCQKESSCLEYSYRSVVWGERPYDVLRNDIRICEVDRRGIDGDERRRALVSYKGADGIS